MYVLIEDIGLSFQRTAEKFCKALEANGITCYLINHQRAAYDDTLIYWTFQRVGNKCLVSRLAKRQLLFNVSDTTLVNPYYVENCVNKYFDALITPSEWSAQGYINGGLKIPVIVLPHPIDGNFPYKPTMEPYDVYIEAKHSHNRKGFDIALNALKDSNLKVVVRSLSKIENLPSNFINITGDLPDEQHYGIMAAARVFVHPARGGAFEIPVLNALAQGLTVMIPEKGPWAEIPLNKDDVYWIPVKGEVPAKSFPEWKDNDFHIGNWVEPDLKLEDIIYAVNHPKKYDNRKYLEYYSPKNIGKMFMEAYMELF